jgi:hypothetical protein
MLDLTKILSHIIGAFDILNLEILLENEVGLESFN